MLNKFLSYSLNRVKNLRKTIINSPRVLDKPIGKNILVLAPHFDDATFGAGGTLRKHIQTKDKVSIVYITDSSNGIPKIKNKKLVTEIRKKEAQEAMHTLGIYDIYYLNEVDGMDGLKEESIDELNKIIHKLKPDLIYLPWFLDNHVDHLKANKLLLEAYKIKKFNCNICAYEIWTPLIPNLIIDVESVYKIKMKAIKKFASQLKQVNYDKIIEGLNCYRSGYSHRKSNHAEAFLFLPIRDYFNTFK